MQLSELVRRCIRIFHIARKPTRQEFWKVAKVAAAGMVAFGVIGLVVSLVFNLI